MKALLTLEDGFSLEGRSFTGPVELAGGEVIFNTASSGYQELITDPSYAGQMVCLTYPLIGNYGINPEDMESGGIHMSALIVKECCKEPSNWRSKESSTPWWDASARCNALSKSCAVARRTTRFSSASQVWARVPS